MEKAEITLPRNIEELYSNIRNILQSARKRVYPAVNFAMVESYWLIGHVEAATLAKQWNRNR